MADGNGRVQRMIFQLVLFRFNFLPRVNIPVSVVMLQEQPNWDRTGYEVMQQGHVDQMMAGLRHELVRLKGESEDSFQHVRPHESLGAIYCYQDFTFTVSCMTKLMQNTLPVLAAKAYFLRRFDWRVDELLKDDALLPPLAATKTPGWERTADVDVEVSLTSVAERGWGWNERGWWRMVGCGVWEWEMEQGSREM
eukprot:g19922.t1